MLANRVLGGRDVDVEGGSGGSNTTGASLSVPLLRVCCGLLPLHSLLGADDDDVASSVAVVKDVTLCSSVRPRVGMPRLSGDGGELGLLPPPPPREKSGMAGAEAVSGANEWIGQWEGLCGRLQEAHDRFRQQGAEAVRR